MSPPFFVPAHAEEWGGNVPRVQGPVRGNVGYGCGESGCVFKSAICDIGIKFALYFPIHEVRA